MLYYVLYKSVKNVLFCVPYVCTYVCIFALRRSRSAALALELHCIILLIHFFVATLLWRRNTFHFRLYSLDEFVPLFRHSLHDVVRFLHKFVWDKSSACFFAVFTFE
jgi:hypothetical protein